MWIVFCCCTIKHPKVPDVSMLVQQNSSIHIVLQFEFNYSAHEPPSMQNDTITVNRRQAADHQVKLAICHALAQVSSVCYSHCQCVSCMHVTTQTAQRSVLQLPLMHAYQRQSSHCSTIQRPSCTHSTDQAVCCSTAQAVRDIL